MAHVLVLPYPSQGHVNPMLEFARRLAAKGPKATLVTTHFIANNTAISAEPVQVASISDGHDSGGFASATSLEDYLAALEAVGSATLAELIEAEGRAGRAFTCMVYDSYAPWAVPVARRFGLPTVAFSTQSCAVSAVYHYVNLGALGVPERDAPSVAFAGLPAMERWEFPSFALKDGEYPTLSSFALKQFELEKDDWVLFNSFEELESEVVAGLTGHWIARSIGPCVPLPMTASGADSSAYGMNLLDPEDACLKWLDTKPPGSVTYVSFGSFASIGTDQMEELAQGLMASEKPFLWVVRATEQKHLPRHLLDGVTADGDALVVRWCPQLDVLAHGAVGCFLTHCGWNSTLEALSYGVPMVALALWTDQPTNAKYIGEVWGVGVRASRDGRTGLIPRCEIERCVRAVMEEGSAVAAHARRWREAARAAVGAGGSSDKNLDEFVEFLRAGAEGQRDKWKASFSGGTDEAAASEM